MPARQMFRASYNIQSLQAQARQSKEIVRKFEAVSRKNFRLTAQIATAVLYQRKVYYAPEHDWINAAAERALHVSPRPNQHHLIKHFYKVSYSYARIVVGSRRTRQSSNFHVDPVEELLYQCLLSRVEAARIAFVDPGSEKRRLEQKALRKNWPGTVLQRRLQNLEYELEERHERLDLDFLKDLFSELSQLERKKANAKIQLWERSDKWKYLKRDTFAQMYRALEEKLRFLDEKIYFLQMELWEKWLDMQVVKIFHELEADILQMAQFGVVKDSREPEGRSAIQSKTSLYRVRNVVVIAEVENRQSRDAEDSHLGRRVYSVFAIVLPRDHRQKQARRLKPQKNEYCNRSSKSMRPRYR